MVTKVDYSDFMRRYRTIRRNIMVYVEIAADEIVQKTENETFPLVPFLYGYLEDSIYVKYISPAPNLVLEMLYAAYNPWDGYNYALIQHENLKYHHPIRKANKRPQAKFLTTGFDKSNPEEVLMQKLLVVFN